MKLKNLNAEGLDPGEQDKLAQSIIDFCVTIIRADENAQTISEIDEEE